MDNNELVIVENQEYMISQFPNIIKGQIDSLKLVKEKNKEAAKKAEEARKKAENLKPYKFFKQKAAVEDIQTAVGDLASAQEAIVEAQDVGFEYQQKLGETSKFLFKLGVANRAANRSVVREVRLLLSNASQEELDDFAIKELEGVIRELNEQEDIAAKQQELFDYFKEDKFLLDKHERGLDYVNKRLSGIREKEIEFEKAIIKNEESIAKNTNRIFQNEKKGREYEDRLSIGEKKDNQHDQLIKKQQEVDKEHEKLISARERKDAEQDKQLSKQMKKDAEHDESLQDLYDKIKTLEEKDAELMAEIINLEECILKQNHKIRELEEDIRNYDKLAQSMKKKKWALYNRGGRR